MKMHAQRAVQLQDRQSYRGGWALGFTTAPCPADAPVGCQFVPDYNLNCCPEGQFCFGTLQPYCCPTGEFLPMPKPAAKKQYYIPEAGSSAF
jgi:hypothetical protein